jgi:hypothetical protein
MQFITKQHISRRTILRGVGAAISLPLLESMVPAQTAIRKTAAATKTRFAVIENPHGDSGSTADGWTKNYWSPKQVGSDFEMTPTLSSLESHKDYLTIISNTDLRNAMSLAPPEEGADHTRSASVFLTGAHPKRTEGSDILLATSIDQLYAQQHGQDTPLPSIQLCIEDVGSLNGACGYGYSCVYANSISWAGPTTPLPHEMDPRVVFERLFGDGGTAAERAEHRSSDRSVLDAITNKVGRLQKGLPAGDKARLNDYLEGIREIERRIQKIEAYNSANGARSLPTAPIGVPDSFDDHVALMMDLQVLAFMADITRVSSMMMGRDVSSRVFPTSGVKTPFHSLSHHGENPEKVAEFAKLNRYHVSKAAYFIDKLANTPDGDGSLLDHTLVMYGSPMGDGNVHAHKRVPVFLAGKANGKVKGNQHIMAKDETPMANALLSIMQALDVKVETVGDANGTIAI